MKQLIIICLLLLTNIYSLQAATPRVIVTIKPLHSLVMGVMKGVDQPHLLTTADQSPHVASLTPDQVSAVHQANVVIWVGPSYESKIGSLINILPRSKTVITWLKIPGMSVLPQRQGGLWAAHTHDECHDCHQEHTNNRKEHHHEPLSPDGHIWLDPRAAQAFVKEVAEKLATFDPQHQTRYLANAQEVIARLQELDLELDRLFEAIQAKPFITYHDGTQYLDRRYRLNCIGSVTGDFHGPLAPHHVIKLREAIRDMQVTAVFTEPQFPVDRIECLVQRTDTRVGSLDYLGVDLTADEDAYFHMMRRIANTFIKVLS